jgi:hypothetical protein
LERHCVISSIHRLGLSLLGLNHFEGGFTRLKKGEAFTILKEGAVVVIHRKNACV